MNSDAYRDWQLLNDIGSNGAVTQRHLAKKQGLALGLTNLLIRRLVKKGYIKIIGLRRNRLQYLLTPKGFSEQARLTYEFLEYSLYFYRHIRTFLTQAVAEVRQAGCHRVVLCGTGEVAEIAFLVLQQQGMDVVAVVDRYVNGGTFFMHHPVRSLAELPTLTFDRAVVASWRDRDAMAQELSNWGVPPEKLIVIPLKKRAGSVPVERVALVDGVPAGAEETRVS